MRRAENFFTAKRLTVGGISTTKENGSFRWERFQSVSGKTLVQWDYRDKSGFLTSGVCGTLEEAKKQATSLGWRENK
jgi:hypothetical protein